jgi:LysM repeat protein
VDSRGLVTGRQQLARLAAPAAFLLGATVLVLLVRSSLEEEPAATTPATTAPSPTTTAATTTPTTTAAETEPEAFYTIQSGDTLESIAAAYGTTVEELLRLNPGIDPTSLTIGQRIQVPPS